MISSIRPHRTLENLYAGNSALGGAKVAAPPIQEPPAPPIQEPPPPEPMGDYFVPLEPEVYSYVPPEVPIELSEVEPVCTEPLVESVAEALPVVQEYQSSHAPPQTLAILEDQNLFTIC